LERYVREVVRSIQTRIRNHHLQPGVTRRVT
jgi:hypothetical protein